MRVAKYYETYQDEPTSNIDMTMQNYIKQCSNTSNKLLE